MTKLIAILTIMMNNYYFDNNPSALIDSFTWASTEYACKNENDKLACEYICAYSEDWLSGQDVLAAIPQCKEVFEMGELK